MLIVNELFAAQGIEPPLRVLFSKAHERGRREELPLWSTYMVLPCPPGRDQKKALSHVERARVVSDVCHCECCQLATLHGLQDGFAFRGQAVNGIPDELLEVSFALDEEGTADPGELVSPVFCHLQGKLLHLRAVDQHKSSSPVLLYLSWERTHS